MKNFYTSMVYSFVTMYCIIRTIMNNKLHTSLSKSYDFRSLWISWGSYRWSVYRLDSLKTNNKAVVHRRQRRRGCRGRDLPIFDLQGSSCVDDPPPIFWQVFYFFPSAGVLNTASRCHFHLQCAQCTVFNSTVEQNSLRITTCVPAPVSLVRHKLVLL